MSVTESKSSLFADIKLAARIERAECYMVGEAANAVANRGRTKILRLPIGGGLALWAGADSPINKVAGTGFEGSIAANDLSEIESAYAKRNAPVRFELSSLADPSIGEHLTERGYRLRGFEDVLGCAPQPDAAAPAPGVHIEESPADDIERWIDTMTTAFMVPDTQGQQSQQEIPREAIEHALRDMVGGPMVTRYLATLNGEVAGAGSLQVHDHVAIFSGAATLQQHRRRGVQSTLLNSRLNAAAQAGCDLGIVTTMPGSTSQQNVVRKGFRLLYTRAVLELDPPARNTNQ